MTAGVSETIFLGSAARLTVPPSSSVNVMGKVGAGVGVGSGVAVGVGAAVASAVDAVGATGEGDAPPLEQAARASTSAVRRAAIGPPARR